MHRLALRTSALVPVLAALLSGCADGEEGPNTSFTTFPPPSSNPTTTPPATGTDPTTGEPGTTMGPADPTTDTDGPPPNTTTSPVDPTTGVPDPSTTLPDPSTTTTNPDPSNPDPSDPSTSTGMMSSMPMTSMTNDDTTGDPPDPPGNDPQPNTGMYEHCTMPEMCDAPSNVCLQLNDMNMNVTDGYCTILCQNVGQCGTPPDSNAVQECFVINAMNQKLCGLKCAAPADCPTGMVCTNLALPNNQSGFYCI